MNVSSRKPLMIAIGLAIFLAGTVFLVMSRQERFLQTVSVFQQNQHNRQQPPQNVPERFDRIPAAYSNYGYRVQKVKDVTDNSGAITYLSDYQNKFAFSNWTGGPGNPNRPGTISQWWQAAAMIDWYINTPLRYECQDKVAYGNWHVCQDKAYSVQPPCLVYSFGINWDYSFDDAMGKLGCEVHSFDPSMGVSGHRRSQNVTFHNLGLGSINTDGFVARQDMYVTERKVWKLRTVKAIKQMLGHSNRVIDVFKMDVEGYEWNVLDHMMETDMFHSVRQFMLEFHLFPEYPLKEDYVNIYNIYRRVRELGLREYSIGPHPKTLTLDAFNNQGDSEFVNVHFNQQSRDKRHINRLKKSIRTPPPSLH